eukprot:COSAG02_NODE_70424_length_196_cov_18.670103_1_plen_65_part_11
MALYTLGCRNGTAVCGREDVAEETTGTLIRWFEDASRGGDDYVAGAACGACWGLVCWYSGTKVPS